MSFRLSQMSFSYQKIPILKEISLDSLGVKGITAVIGPNGSGKSTLFKCLAGMLKVPPNSLFFNGMDLSLLGKVRIAKEICYMPQDSSSNAMLSVFESVLLARKISKNSTVTKADLKLVEHVLDALGVSHLSQAYISKISGGQQQLVAIAQAICRIPQVLLLDEPTSALDLQHQLEIFAILQKLTQDYQITCLIAIHDLNLAARFATKIVVMQHGKVVKEGTDEEVFNTGMLKEVYQIHAEVALQNKQTQIYPIRSTRKFLQHLNLEAYESVQVIH